MRKLFVLLALPALAAPAIAADGRIPVYQLPSTLSEPGSYYLTGDLSGAPGGPLVTIASDNVTFDLAGHTLERTDGASDVIGSSGNPTNVEITNGRIIGGYNGIYLRNVAGTSFNVRLTDLIIADSAADGIYVEGAFEVIVPGHLMIERNMVSNVGGHGIAVSFMDNGRIAQNVVRDAATDGIHVESSQSISVDDNVASENGRHGAMLVSTSHSHLRGNLFQRNGQYGIMFDGTPTDGDNSISDNRLYGNTTDEYGVQNQNAYLVDNLGGNYPQ